MNQGSSWIQIFKSRKTAKARLLCFPFAGGGAQIFSEWHQSLPEEIEVCAVRLPGREVRIKESALPSMEDVVNKMLNSGCLDSYLDKPLFLFGHSMGALIAYEIARSLEKIKKIKLEKLIVSGRVAPHKKPPREPVFGLPKSEFVDALRKLGGTPKEVLEDEDLMKIILPILRADFEVNENYIYRDDSRITSDIIAFSGLRDQEVKRTDVESWQEVTEGEFSLRMVPGDHFFIQTSQKLFLRMLSIELYEAINLLPAAENLADSIC